MIKKSDSKWVSLATVSILGQLLGVESQEESSLPRFYNDALRKKMRAENGYSWAREVYYSGHDISVEVKALLVIVPASFFRRIEADYKKFSEKTFFFLGVIW